MTLPVLQPINVQPIVRPEFDNRNLHSFGQWLDDNFNALNSYYEQLRGSGEPLDCQDPFDFAPMQHEIELMNSAPYASQREQLERV